VNSVHLTLMESRTKMAKGTSSAFQLLFSVVEAELCVEYGLNWLVVL
jgi:hypothetical protein